MEENENKTKEMVEIVQENPQLNNTDTSNATLVVEKNADVNLTLSTKLSTDQLICKTPRDSSASSSVRSSCKKNKDVKKCVKVKNNMFYLGMLQVLFGFLMIIFGVLVILHESTLSRIGAGIWGGGLAVTTGLLGISSAAKACCPLKPTAQTFAHTIYLTLSLISLAISQLVVVLAATGLARDINSNFETEELESRINKDELSTPENKISIVIPENYLGILSNIGLLIVSSIECVCASVAAYKCARSICPCFKKNNDSYTNVPAVNNSHAIVSSWLGKQTPPPQLYIVAPPSLGKSSKLSGGLPITPVFALPPPMLQPHMMGYPLIPAPLGNIPSPIIHPRPRKMIISKKHKKYYKNRQMVVREHTPKRGKHRSRSHSEERHVTEEEVARTYTGLDRTVAEEFIDICDSKNSSLCSRSSCTSSACQSGCTNSNTSNSSSECASREYLVNK